MKSRKLWRKGKRSARNRGSRRSLFLLVFSVLSVLPVLRSGTRTQRTRRNSEDHGEVSGSVPESLCEVYFSFSFNLLLFSSRNSRSFGAASSKRFHCS